MTTPSQIAAVVDWIIDGARSATQPQDIVRQLCERLLECGLPLLRVGVFVRTPPERCSPAVAKCCASSATPCWRSFR